MKFHINPSINPATSLRVFPVWEKQWKSIRKTHFSDSLIPGEVFTGKKDSIYFLPEKKGITLLLGLEDHASYKEIEQSFRRILSKYGESIGTDITLTLAEFTEPKTLEAALVGLGLGTYHADFFKKERKNTFEDLQVHIYSTHPEIEQIVLRSEKILAAKIEALRLVDLPPNILTPAYLADWSVKMAEQCGLSATVLDSEKAKEAGLEAFLAVARGSFKPARFIILEYRHPKAKRHLGLVGKGVTFDTGGLNIKTQGMHFMKSDMGGAAAVLAATQLIASLQLPLHLTTIVPAVENALDQHAYLPSEVIGSHVGLSIEIVDTDAEGRLILADGLSYLNEHYQPDHLVDVATLTGSAVGTFGYACAALFSEDEQLSQQIQQAGNAVGEKTWPLPLWKEYAREMDSEIADIRNYHGKPIAGAITAATFLQAFTKEHPSWAHLDIAGVAFGDHEFSKSKSATAYGVNLLLNLADTLI